MPPSSRTDSWERDNSIASGPRNGRHNRQGCCGGDNNIRTTPSRRSGSARQEGVAALGGLIQPGSSICLAMPNPIATLATPRLVAEAITPLHFHDLHRLLSDPLVMKTLSADGKPLSETTIREQIEQNIDHWQQQGFGFWVFHRKKDGQFIGRGGLKTYQIDGKDVIGLAYAVMPDYWNRGFATEMAEASLDVGFGQLGPDVPGMETIRHGEDGQARHDDPAFQGRRHGAVFGFRGTGQE